MYGQYRAMEQKQFRLGAPRQALAAVGNTVHGRSPFMPIVNVLPPNQRHSQSPENSPSAVRPFHSGSKLRAVPLLNSGVPPVLSTFTPATPVPAQTPIASKLPQKSLPLPFYTGVFLFFFLKKTMQLTLGFFLVCF